MKYLSELRKELPVNCLFNKQKIGCGGTTLAIESKKPYVICVPYSRLVYNKVAQYPNERYSDKLFGVAGGVTPLDIKKYINEVEVPKIVVTYDSLPKVMEVINPKDYSILIDEYHILFTQYGFRSEAVKYVLNHFRDFKEFCFMTATPIEDEFILEELKGIPVVNQEWDNVATAKVYSIKCESVIASTAKLIYLFLTGQYKGNAYLFLNSTKTIKKLVKMMNLTEENTRVIYSQHSRVNVGIERGSTLDKPKKINFLTSTAFEGCDIYDKEGRIFIISDPNAQYSLLDVGTSVQQITGRIRDSKYIGQIVHLYSENRYASINYEDFKKSQEEETIKCKRLQKEFSKLSNEAIKTIKDLNSLYLTKTSDNNIEFDPNLVKIDTFNYKVANTYTLRITLDEAYQNNDYEVISEEDMTKMRELGDIVDKPTITFKEVINELEGKSHMIANLIIKNYISEFPLLRDAYYKLGIEQIKYLKYVQEDIKKELLKLDKNPIDYRIIKALNYKNGEFKTLKQIKSDLTNIFDTLEIHRSVTASSIEKYYDIKKGMKTFNGKRIHGIFILRPKLRKLDK